MTTLHRNELAITHAERAHDAGYRDLIRVGMTRLETRITALKNWLALPDACCR